MPQKYTTAMFVGGCEAYGHEGKAVHKVRIYCETGRYQHTDPIGPTSKPGPFIPELWTGLGNVAQHQRRKQHVRPMKLLHDPQDSHVHPSKHDTDAGVNQRPQAIPHIASIHHSPGKDG